MTTVQIKGNHLKGTYASDNHAEAEALKLEKEADGFNVVIRRKFETFKGERIEVDPPVLRIMFDIQD